MGHGPIEVLTVDSAEVAARAAGIVATALRAALATGPRASLAVSGGTTPWPMFEHLATLDLPWERVDLHQVDERVVPLGHGSRNLTGIATTLADRVPLVLHPMPVDRPDLTVAAGAYAALLPRHLDVVHLGLGADGHTASLVPGDPALDVVDREVALTAPYQGTRRMTLTLPALERAGLRLWLVTGEDKRPALERLLRGDRSIPAGRVGGQGTVVTDLRVGSPATVYQNGGAGISERDRGR